MKRKLALLVATGMLLCAWPAEVYGAPEDVAQTSDEAFAGAETEAEMAPMNDNLVVTKHEAVIQGETIPYTAEAGTVVLESGGKTCEMFYTAYTRDDVEDINDRPITFAFNGGPGSSSYCIQFCLGPRRPELDETGYALALPGKMIDNENSVLDMTDLVFIDPVGTGYSHAVGGDETEDFIGYDNDIRSVGNFIRQYVNRHKRWGSKKYIAGESYGTVRAVGLCEYLMDQYSMYLNGLMLISCVNNYMSVIAGNGNDIPYALCVPSYAAVAWYQGRLSEEYQEMELEEYLKEVRAFVEKELVPVLFLGKKAAGDEKEKLAEKLAGYLGVSKEFVLKENLRIELDDFREELLRDEKLVTGRYDGRITGPATIGSDGVGDPSGSNVDIAFVSPYLNYVTEELQFETDIPFIPLSGDINNAWEFPISNLGGYISQEDIVYTCMSDNPYLKVWVLCGYYDCATPFYSAEWIFNHVFLDEENEENLTFTYYPSGHMIYIDKSSFDKFRKDAEEWYK